MRDDFSKEERKGRTQALELNPPPDALHYCVNDASRLWERRRMDSDFLQPRVAAAGFRWCRRWWARVVPRWSRRTSS